MNKCNVTVLSSSPLLRRSEQKPGLQGVDVPRSLRSRERSRRTQSRRRTAASGTARCPGHRRRPGPGTERWSRSLDVQKCAVTTVRLLRTATSVAYVSHVTCCNFGNCGSWMHRPKRQWAVVLCMCVLKNISVQISVCVCVCVHRIVSLAIS